MDRADDRFLDPFQRVERHLRLVYEMAKARHIRAPSRPALVVPAAERGEIYPRREDLTLAMEDNRADIRPVHLLKGYGKRS